MYMSMLLLFERVGGRQGDEVEDGWEWEFLSFRGVGALVLLEEWVR